MNDGPGEVHAKVTARTTTAVRVEHPHAASRALRECAAVVVVDVAVEWRASGDERSLERCNRFDHVRNGDRLRFLREGLAERLGVSLLLRKPFEQRAIVALQSHLERM